MAKKTLYIYNPVSIQSLVANGFIGSAGSILTSNGSAVYWNDDPGFTGSRGFTGSQGVIGYTGSKGDIGYTGSRGADGTSVTIIGSVSTSTSLPGYPSSYTGSIGDGYIVTDTGNLWIWDGAQWEDAGQIRGYTGSQGVIGYTGSLGYTGSRGFTGSAGFTGSSGFTGSAGTNGFTGSAGTNGFTGSIGFTGSQGNIGYTGSIGFTGSRGDTGFTGSFGFTGSQGYRGGLVYQFSQEVLDADPGAGVIRFNSATIASVTSLYIDLVDQYGYSLTNFINTWDDSTNPIRGHIVIQPAISSVGSPVVFNINGVVTTATGYRKVAVAYVSGTLPTDGDLLSISYSRAGDVGYTGSNGFTGSIGFTGSQGTTGFTGSAGTNGFTGSAGTNGFTGSQGATGFTGSGYGTTASVQMGSLGVGTPASGTSGEIRATNNITAYYTSDRKFKENIRDIPSALDIVSEIGGKLFDWTDEYIAEHGGEDGYFIRKSDFGIVAQDALKVFPPAVRIKPDGTLAVDYEKLCALAFQAIKELKQQVEELKNGNT